MKLTKRFLTLVLVLLFQFSFAQDILVKGVVTDAGLLPLPGVSIVRNGTNQGTTSGMDGEFTIRANKGDKLTFTFIGMVTQSVTVSGPTMKVSLQEDTTVLDDVIISSGYVSSVKVKSAIAAQTVTAETIQSRPNQSFVQTLQGQVAGLNIMTGSGEPGAASSITIRGLSSITGSSEPLFVIDGVQMGSANFRSLNPNEIESVTVLKDAGATAIYGNRGANGVILVTTKRGTYDTPLKITYLGSTGVSFLQQESFNMMNSKQLLSVQREFGQGMGVGMTDAEIEAFDINTKWSDVFLRKGITQNHTLNLQSGGSSLASFTSFGFSDTEGILQNSDIKKFTFRNNLSGKSKRDNFKYSISTNLNYSKRHVANDAGTSSVNQNTLMGAFSSIPMYSPDQYTSGADLASKSVQLANIPFYLMNVLRDNKNETDELKAIMALKGDLKLAKGLNFIGNVGLDYTGSNSNSFVSPTSFNGLYFRTSPNATNGQKYGGSNSFGNTRTFYSNVNAQLRYNFTLGEDHDFEVSALTEYYKGHYRYNYLQQKGLDPKTSAPWAGTGWIGYNNTAYYVPAVSAQSYDAGLFSYFGYLNYDYKSKYGANVTVRRDASYRFSDTNRWGTFWSVAGRWNISQEDFMQDSVFNELKLRGSYGKTGNQQISGSSLFDARDLQRTLYSSGNGYNGQTGYAISQLGNNDLKWETTLQANIGLDFEVFDTKLRGAIDVYDKVTSDLYILNPLSYTTGFASLNTNSGKLRNRGIEGNLAFDVIRQPENQFRFTINGNIAYNKNKILSLGGEDQIWDGSDDVGLWVGHRIWENYLIPYAGVNPATGNALFLDRNGNYTETPDLIEDRRFTGKSRMPEFQGGFGFDLEYKGWYLNTLFTYVTNVYRYNVDYSGFMDENSVSYSNKSVDLLRAWTPTNTVTDVPRLGYTNQDYIGASDRFLQNASYLRLRNISLGYNFSPAMLSKTAFNSLKVFAMAENLVTWSEWRGWDAESSRNYDMRQYPTPRTVTVGLEVSF